MFSEAGWIPLQHCVKKGLRIAITGDGEYPVQLYAHKDLIGRANSFVTRLFLYGEINDANRESFNLVNDLVAVAEKVEDLSLNRLTIPGQPGASTAWISHKVRVYDILNAGPKRRFTWGLLVHNCVIHAAPTKSSLQIYTAENRKRNSPLS